MLSTAPRPSSLPQLVHITYLDPKVLELVTGGFRFNFFMLQMRKAEPKKRKEFAQGHTTSEALRLG